MIIQEKSRRWNYVYTEDEENYVNRYGGISMGALVAGCGSDSYSGQAANGKQVIKVGTNATFVPFEFKDESSQDLTGFDIDMVKAIAKKMTPMCSSKM